ncbi:type 4a pilus biogenesis protein PilO [Actinoplanes sp. NPDC049599]|uniref:type 4a pilus biogenesis protein PilO n=1 Tax=Actinoplanes sp. NPDC049599 TaxID=3363903 RepID=UPI0037A1EAC4
MGARHADRLWMIAGAAVIVLLAVVSWFLLINPEKTETADLKAQTETARAQAVDIRKRIATLKKQKSNLTKLKATLAGYQDALPSDSGVPAFLRQLQASGTDLNVDVSGVTVSTPAELKDLPGVWALPIQLTAEGSADDLGTFLDELQGADQKRAVLIESANLTSPQEETESADGAEKMSVSLAVKAFVAPPVGSGAPTVTTD